MTREQVSRSLKVSSRGFLKGLNSKWLADFPVMLNYVKYKISLGMYISLGTFCTTPEHLLSWNRFLSRNREQQTDGKGWHNGVVGFTTSLTSFFLEPSFVSTLAATLFQHPYAPCQGMVMVELGSDSSIGEVAGMYPTIFLKPNKIYITYAGYCSMVEIYNWFLSI